MRLSRASYEEMRRSFAWDIPQTFNIADAICGRHAAATPEAVALVFEQADGRVTNWSFARVEESANRFANALAALGVREGVVVGIGLPQSPETLIAHVAVQKLGAIALPLFALFGPDAIAYRLADSQAHVLITSAPALEQARVEIDRIATLAHRVVVAGDARHRGEENEHDFWDLIGRASSAPRTTNSAAEDPALLIYTSGTTGNPKGVLHAARVLLGHLPGVVLPQDFFPEAGDRFWTPADWAWAGGLLDVLMPSLYFGVTVVGSARAKFDPEWAFALMARHGVRNVFMPPTALRLMRQVADPRRFGCSLRSIGTGGERLGEDMIAWGQDTFGLAMNEFYGQTEVNLVVGNSSRLYPVRPGSMGRAIPGHTVAVVGPDGQELPAGEPGIVAVRRPDPVMFLEYWRNSAATAEKFKGDWCLLGDIAIKDDDGYFWYKGRDDDIISSAAYRIGPGEVEECLMKHPAVALAGVIGSPDKIRGEVVTAFIVVREGVAAGPELAADIQSFVRRRLAAHEYPRIIRFISEMPMTVTGKIRRVDLRKMDVQGGNEP